MRFLPENNLAYPVLIKMDTGSCGSGFFLLHENNIYLVTAKHVFLDTDKDIFLCNKEFEVTAYSADHRIKEPIKFKIQIDSVTKDVRKHERFDVVVIKVAEVKSSLGGERSQVAFTTGIVVTQNPPGSEIVWLDSKKFKKYDDVFISNDIFVLGYPVSVGLKDYEQIDPDRPLLRKGIVAGKNERKRTIILDSAIYFGNSGGLVIEVSVDSKGTSHYLPIGVISEYVPFVEQLYSLQHKQVVSVNHANSSYSIAVPIDTILDLI